MVTVAAKSKNLKIRENNTGFSIIEVLVALGIMSMVGLGVMTVASDSGTHSQILKNKLELLEIEQAIVRLVSDKNSCGCMFQGIALPGAGGSVNLNALKNGCKVGVGANLLQAGNPPNATSMLTIDTIKLTNFEDLTLGNKAADIEIEVTSQVGSFRKIVIPSNAFVIQAGAISKCVGPEKIVTPISKCAKDGKTFVGFQPLYGQTPDGNGCLPVSAFQGPQGAQGPQGRQGVIGEIPPPPPPPAPRPPPRTIIVSGTYGATCPPGGFLMSCWETGSGRNHSMTYNNNGNGCVAWEGSGNGGYAGCACRCGIP